MPDVKFPILGTVVPPMLGRTTVMQRVMAALTKDTPDHLQVVGPRFAGKTVFLHGVAERLRSPGFSYSAVIMWDLGHRTPETDALFMQRFAFELSGALTCVDPDYGEYIANSQNPYQDIAEVLAALKDDGAKVLVIMDGFDKPLSNGQLTRNLWDQLRELALIPSLRLVTASRSTLRDLIRHPEAQTSDFWNIFNPNPVRLGCFDEQDLDGILEMIPNRQFSKGARTELWNASNGFPVFMLGVLNAVCESDAVDMVTIEEMQIACDTAFPSIRDGLDTLWSDCVPSSQDLLRRVLEESSVARMSIATADAEMLIERGFVITEANKLQRPSRLLERYLNEQPHEGNALVRLFGTDGAYLRNLKGVLERRIGQVENIDPTLRRYLIRATADLPDHPSVFLTNIRGIVDKAFDLIWDAELPGKKIPSEWIANWERNNERGLEKIKVNFPRGVHRVRLLNLMTGTEKSDRCAACITKETYVLVNAVHAFGDFGQHQEGEAINAGTAYAALHICIEMAVALSRELPVT